MNYINSLNNMDIAFMVMLVVELTSYARCISPYQEAIKWGNNKRTLITGL